MRCPVTLLLAATVGGCSLIYSPANIPPPIVDAIPDVLIDAPFDGDPTRLMLDDVAPHSVLEGQGDGGSPSQILVIHGANIVVGAQVAITGANISVDNSHLTVATVFGDFIAVPITAHVDGSISDGTSVPLTIEVTQPVPGGGMATQSLSGKLTLQGLDELSAAPSGSDASMLRAQYSIVNLNNSSPIAFVGGATNHAVLIRAVSSIQINDVTAKGGSTANTNGGAAGPGGCAGGAAVSDGGCAGFGHHGSSTGVLSNGGGGGGAGFSSGGTAGSGTGSGPGGTVVGDDAISAYAGVNASVPSGGGGGGAGTLSSGGGGGGGGGIVELTAGGDVTVGNVDVSGGNGGFSGSGGGGGAGGIIMVRAGRTLTTSMLTAAGGSGGGTSGNVGGLGSPGRIRWDAPSGSAPNAAPGAVRGPSFVNEPAVITDATFQLIGSVGHKFDVTVFDANMTPTPGPQGVMFAANGNASFVAPLVRGFDRVCITLMGGSSGTPEADKCVDVAFLPN